MILEKLDVVSHIIEIVNGEDIVDTYTRNINVPSCMSVNSDEVRNRLRFYTIVDNMALMRIRTMSARMTCIMRALIWTGKDETGKDTRVLDRIYVSSDKGATLATQYWQKFADIKKDTKRQIICTFSPECDWVKNHIQGTLTYRMPYLDTFRYYDMHTGQISNQAFKSAVNAR
jgi:hypothetical protein